MVTVNTPAFAESVTEGDVRWEKAIGDSVAEDEVVCEIETDKVRDGKSFYLGNLLLLSLNSQMSVLGSADLGTSPRPRSRSDRGPAGA